MESADEYHKEESAPPTKGVCSSNSFNQKESITSEQVSRYCREFLLICLEATPAVTYTLRLLGGCSDALDILTQHRTKWKSFETNFIVPISDLSVTNNHRHSSCYLHSISCLKTYGKHFFSNFYSLNCAFIPKSTGCLLDVTIHTPHIQWDTVNQFFLGLTQVLDSMEELESEDLVSDILHGLCDLLDRLDETLTKHPQSFIEPLQLRFILLLMGFPLLDSFSQLSQTTLEKLHSFCSQLPSSSIDILTTWYTSIPASILQQHLANTQQLITFRLLDVVGDDGIISNSIGPCLRRSFDYLKILFEANKRRSLYICTSLTPDALQYNEECHFINDHTNPTVNESLMPIQIEEFYNDAINSTEKLIRHDFIQWKRQEESDFQLLSHAFILDASSKIWYLLLHSLIDQEQRGREALMQFFWVPIVQPYFILRVRRSEIVHDSLQKLTATVAQADLKKQLKVVFDEEEGVDEGGVRKEFFQLLVEQLFNPDYGMFIYIESTRIFWFNGCSLESNLQFELIGVVLGLAIYNGVILDIHFPLTVYKKLLGVPVGLKDLEEFQPDIAKSLRQLLLMQSSEVDACHLTFSVDVNIFGTIEPRPLLDSYSQDEPVTADNRLSYVEAYIDWKLNHSIEQQFKAFERGFMKCCDGNLLKLMFQPKELLLLVCGLTLLDLFGLEATAKYQDGYTKDSETIKDFWEVAHSLTQENKRRLLFFITGSDRVPIKGLGTLQLYIGRGGSETDKIPTAHTCFNYLLLPDYRNKEKLERFLFIALENHRGFGLR